MSFLLHNIREDLRKTLWLDASKRRHDVAGIDQGEVDRGIHNLVQKTARTKEEDNGYYPHRGHPDVLETSQTAKTVLPKLCFL